MKAVIEQRLTENLGRVENLVKIYEGLKTPGQGRKNTHDTDILRAAVVLLHASMEDFLRSLARWKLPASSNAQVLEQFPFPGSKPGQRAEKVNLGFFANHRGKTVDEIIRTAVEEHLDRSSYNNIQEIRRLLESIGVTVANVNQEFPTLEQTMTRRHMVVHQADRDDAGDQGSQRLKVISVPQVRPWIEAVRKFASAVLNQIP